MKEKSLKHGIATKELVASPNGIHAVRRVGDKSFPIRFGVLLLNEQSLLVEPHELDALTETEREVLDATAKQYGKLPAGRLIELTHKEKTWVASNKRRNAGSSVEIPWELFLEGEQPGLREHIDEHQAADAFLQAMTRAARR